MRFTILEDLSVIYEALSEEYNVEQVRPKEVFQWMIDNHYLHREPRAKFAFGLTDNSGKMVGACTYGMPPVRLNDKFEPFPCYDLNRVALSTHEEKNLVSWFIGQTLRRFPVQPAVIVSYADPNEGHAGTIYQALNFIYTGRGKPTERFVVDGKVVPARTLVHRYGTRSIPELRKRFKQEGISFEVGVDEGKHRYFTLVGNKRERKEMLKIIAQFYDITSPYPKAG
jgi:hypothetical protein